MFTFATIKSELFWALFVRNKLQSYMESARLLPDLKNSMEDLRNIEGVCSTCRMCKLTTLLYTNLFFCYVLRELNF